MDVCKITDKFMRCKVTCRCGCNTFIAHQLIRADVLVDGYGIFLSYIPETNGEGKFDYSKPGCLEHNIYDSGKPYGPYQCSECGNEYEEIKFEESNMSA